MPGKALTVHETIAAKQRAMLPMRLLRGAEVLGSLWRDGDRCASGWSPGCECVAAGTATDFCEAKRRWVGLYIERVGAEEARWLATGGPFGLVMAMTEEQFAATGLTFRIQVPGDVTILVGQRGADLSTIRDLSRIRDPKELAEAIRAVKLIQETMS